jgi:hypothetical protein
MLLVSLVNQKKRYLANINTLQKGMISKGYQKRNLKPDYHKRGFWARREAEIDDLCQRHSG